MTLHVKGYLTLALLVMPSLVVSRNPKQDVVNEAMASSFDLDAAEKRTAGLMIDSWALIARPERKSGSSTSSSSSDYTVGVKKPKRQAIVVAGPEGLTLHQQSTNAAAAKRDLHYKQQHGRAARGARDSRMIIGKRSGSNYLSGHINGLKPVEDHESDEQQPVVGFRKNKTHLRSQIVDENKDSREPFIRQTNRERGQIYGLINYLSKDRRPTNLRTFGFQGRTKYFKGGNYTRHVINEASPDEKSIEDGVAPAASSIVPTMIVNSLKDKTSQNYALFHRILNDKLENTDEVSPSPVRSFDPNLVLEQPVDDFARSPLIEKTVEYDEEQDWESSGTQSQDTVDDFNDGAEPEIHGDRGDISYGAPGTRSKYEFGYRVIDHLATSDFGHQESHRGRMTNGRYHVLLPDGRIQRVEYFVDREGYHADVSYTRREPTKRETMDEDLRQ